MTPQLVSDAEARRRIRESLDESLIVEASAGTGKTTALVGRIVEVLRRGKATIDRIAAVTFTNKAAGELKLRLREALDKARSESEAGRAELEHALAHLEEASIGTIHAFCAHLLRERPVEAGVDPAFEELSEPEANRLYQRSFRAWLEQRLGNASPGLKRAFARLAWRDSWDDSPPMEQLQWAGRKLVEWRDYPTPWRRDPGFAREEEIRTLLRKARELSAASAKPRRVTDQLYRSLVPVRLMVETINREERADAEPDYDVLEAQLLKLGRDLRRDTKKGSGEYGGGIKREDLVQSRDEMMLWIEEFRRRADADFAAQLREEMASIVEEYNARKERQGKLDFVDLLIKTRDLLRDQVPVREYLQRRYQRLFVDEFQDTDPLQVEIFRLLSEDEAPGKLFLVGDPKQSIYKFRRADIQLYEQVCADLVAKGVGHVRLTRSFRSVPNIQDFVNAAFETEMTGDGHATYAALEHDREPIPGRPSVIALPVPKPYKMRLAKEAVNKSLPMRSLRLSTG
ncbi:MAG: UvrD-helicase domain-containing protein [Acidobacteriota bacterium]